jgi:sugar phosphate isomerase/epimerase
VSAAGRQSQRVAAHTYSYRNEPLEVALERISGLGFSAVEIWIGHANDGAGRAAKALSESGLEPVAVSAGGFYDELASSAPRSFELALALGVETVVACIAPQALPRLALALPEGLTLCVENHWDQLVRRPEDVLRLCERRPRMRLAGCLDTGHSILAGIRPEQFAARLGPRLAHVHLKDARRLSPLDALLGPRLRRRLRSKPQPVAPGRGDIDVARLLVELDRIDYRGWISVEDEGADVASALTALKDAFTSPSAAKAAELQS